MRRRTLLVLLLVLALFCGGCGAGAPEAEQTAAPTADGELERLADAQLGLLADRITPEERERVLLLLEALEPLRQERQEAGRWEKSAQEERLIRQLNRLYERYTTKYLGDTVGWGYSYPPEYELAEYRITEDYGLRPVEVSEARGYTQADYQSLWEQVLELLPEEALERFSRFAVFTDGPDETLAYVYAADSEGSRWVLAVDPADASDGAWFTETLLHEYCHVLTLNNTQAEYTGRQTTDTYNEEGMVARSGSYLDDFYQEFWTELLDDRLADPDSCGFFLRHEDDFITDYAATDPSEDIAESFTYFLLWPPVEGDEVWERKLNFFYGYPELVELRSLVRDRLALDAQATGP